MKAILSKVFLVSMASVIAVAVVVSFAPPPAHADDASEIAKIVRGGKLYDKWFKVIKADKPKETHKAWPASNTKKEGDVTWRCKSCHGWDYMGKDGAYASGSYQTGIKGVSAYAGKDVASIVAVMKDKTHGLAGKMSDTDFEDLALFVSKGQVDMGKYIDKASKGVKGGNAAQGGVYYNTLCVQCHGADGKLPKDMDPLGKLMGNPWEVMHKIINGQPGEGMPSLRALDPKIVVDIMAYTATLPSK